jgi:hypothetical protein
MSPEKAPKQEGLEERPAPQRNVAAGTVADPETARKQADRLSPETRAAAVGERAAYLAEHALPRLEKQFRADIKAAVQAEAKAAQGYWLKVVATVVDIQLMNKNAEIGIKLTQQKLNAIIVDEGLSNPGKTVKGRQGAPKGLSAGRLIMLANCSNKSLATDRLLKAMGDGPEINGTRYNYGNGGAMQAMQDTGFSMTRVADLFAAHIRRFAGRKDRTARTLVDAVQANADTVGLRVKTRKGTETQAISSSKQASYIMVTHLLKKWAGEWTDAEVQEITKAATEKPAPQTEEAEEVA